MPQQPDSAIPKIISAINADPGLIGQKLRVVGRLVIRIEIRIGSHRQCYPRMLSYDFITAVILLQDEESAVLVDVSLCIEAQTASEWVRERKGLVTAIGCLESLSVSIHLHAVHPVN